MHRLSDLSTLVWCRLVLYSVLLGCVVPEAIAEEPVCLEAGRTAKHGPPTFAEVLDCLTRTSYDSWHQLLRLGRKLTDGDPLRAAYLDHYEARLADSRGDYRRALDFHLRALRVLEERGNLAWRAGSRYSLGILYSVLGRGQEALVHLEAALEAFQELEEPEGEARALTQMGWVFFLQQNEPKATEMLRLALERRTTPKGRATTLDRLGSVHREAGRHDEALRCFRKAFEIFEDLDEPVRGHVLANLGWLELDGGAYAAAEAELRASLPLLRHLGDRDAEAHVLVGLARAVRGRGRPREALEYLENGIRIVEGLRRSTPLRPLRSTYLALRQDYYFDHVDLLLELEALEPGKGYGRRAVLANERGRARALLDLLAQAPALSEGIGERKDDTGGVKLEHLRRRITELQMGAFERQKQGGRLTDSEAGELTQALSSYSMLRNFEADGHQAAVESVPPVVGVAGVQPLLDERTTVLSYVLGEERSYLFLIDRRGFDTFVLPGRSTLETVALDLYRTLAEKPNALSEGQVSQVALDLGEKLLAPVADRLGERVIVVKDGALHQVPFGVLRSSLKPDRPLLRNHVVMAVPSLSSLVRLRHRSDTSPRTPRIAVFAPDAGPSPRKGTAPFPALRSVEAEVRAILAQVPPGHVLRVLGNEATPGRLARTSYASIDVLHLAAHAFVFRSHPELSAIVLNDGRGGDELLRLHEIFDLDIPVDLVILSACETGLGDLLRGEGMVSMAHAFLAAGAARTLVSLWRVDDAATARLMSGFYRAMIEEGQDPASALRRAQIDLLDEHPYFWAAFELQGS